MKKCNNASLKWIGLLVTAVLALWVTGCLNGSDDDEGKEDTVSYTVTDLPADPTSSGVAAYYNLGDSSMIPVGDSNTTNWDISFRGTTVQINGGSSGPGMGAALVLASVVYEDLTQTPNDAFSVDGASGNAVAGWYTYTGAGTAPFHTILVTPGMVIMVRTADGARYAKIKITSYYRGNPAEPNANAPNTTDPGRDEARYYNFLVAFVDAPAAPAADIQL